MRIRKGHFFPKSKHPITDSILYALNTNPLFLSTPMPPRWPRQPDRKTDPDFRRLDDRMNFAVHVAIFAATNSGLWFFRVLGAKTSELGIPGGLPNTPMITGIWAIVLLLHGLYIFAIARYEDSQQI
jgi:2TM domain